MRRLSILALSILILAGASAAAGAGLETSVPYPVVGHVVTVRLTDIPGSGEGVLLSAKYRPNSANERSVEVGAFAADGTVVWTPAYEGIVVLSAKLADGKKSIASMNVAVRYDGVPASGVLVMAFAGLTLFGSAGFFFWRANKKEHRF